MAFAVKVIINAFTCINTKRSVLTQQALFVHFNSKIANRTQVGVVLSQMQELTATTLIANAILIRASMLRI